MTTNVVSGLTDNLDEETYSNFLEEQADEWGDDAEEDAENTLATLEGLEEGEEEENAEEIEGGEDSDEEGEVEEGRESTDEVITRLAETDPEAARVVREMRRTMSKNINEHHAQRDEMLDIQRRLLAREAGLGTPETEEESLTEAPTPPEGVTAQELELFKKVADHLGLSYKEDLEQRDRSSAASGHVNNSLTTGVEQFGEAFGTVLEDGSVVVNPEIQGALDETLSRLTDGSKGVTPLDLFRLTFPDATSINGEGERPAPKTRPKAKATRKASRGTPRTPKANTVRRSSGRRGEVKVYDEKRGDSSEDVFDRSWAVTRTELSSM